MRETLIFIWGIPSSDWYIDLDQSLPFITTCILLKLNHYNISRLHTDICYHNTSSDKYTNIYFS